MKTVHTEHAPQAIGPYVQATVGGGFVWCSGQVAIVPATGKMLVGDVQAETRQALTNLAAVLDAAGSSLENVLRCTVYLKDMDDFKAMNEVYGTFFSAHKPARAAIEIARLPLDAAVEISCVALAT
jgi:2-iminobutanoate/2-iminopropanoate deaminase